MQTPKGGGESTKSNFFLLPKPQSMGYVKIREISLFVVDDVIG